MITSTRSEITDFKGGHTCCIQLRMVGKDGARETNKSVARYIQVLTKLFKLVPNSYLIIGNEGFETVIDAIKCYKSRIAGPNKL